MALIVGGKVAKLNWYRAKVEDGRILSIKYSEESMLEDKPEYYEVYDNRRFGGAKIRIRAKDELHAFALLDKYLSD